MQKKEYEDDVLMLGGHPFHSRFILGSGKFSLSLIQTVMEYGGSEIATIALRRANADSKENILDFLPKNITLLPNTSGARNAEEAIRIARLSRELGCGDFVKVEIIHETKYLLPDNEETIRATVSLQKKALLSCRICIRIWWLLGSWKMPVRLPLCRSVHRLAAIRACGQKTLFAF